MYSPLNYALPAISLLLFFAAGALLKGLAHGFVCRKSGIICRTFPGMDKGQKRNLAEKKTVLESVDSCCWRPRWKSPGQIWEFLMIFPEKDKPGVILENYRKYQAGKSELEKMAARLSGMDSHEIIEKKIRRNQ